jgi:hypothetical protein
MPIYPKIFTHFSGQPNKHIKRQNPKPPTTQEETEKKKPKKKRKTHKSYHLLRLRSAAYCESGTASESGVDSGVGSGEFLQTGQEPFSFSQVSRCAVAAVVMVVAVEGTGGVVGAATEVGGEEDGGDRERRVKRLEVMFCKRPDWKEDP